MIALAVGLHWRRAWVEASCWVCNGPGRHDWRCLEPPFLAWRAWEVVIAGTYFESKPPMDGPVGEVRKKSRTNPRFRAWTTVKCKSHHFMRWGRYGQGEAALEEKTKMMCVWCPLQIQMKIQSNLIHTSEDQRKVKLWDIICQLLTDPIYYH